VLTMRQKKAVTKELRDRYQRASKKEKTMMLNEFIRLTGYNRCYACQILKKKERLLGYLNIAGKRIKYVADRKTKRKKKRFYDQEIFMVLKKIWLICDYICSKRLAPFLSEIIPVLEKHGEINLTTKVREKLFKISAATIDRMLAETRKRYRIKGRSTTRPGSLLKKSIPIRTFADWDEKVPGFFEVDLVSHDGSAVRGDFLQSLNFTDVATGWVEMIAVKNKAQVWVFAGIKSIKERLPFSILGIDSDNGAEFTAKIVRKWLSRMGVKTLFIEPGSPWENGYIESFNGKLRDPKTAIEKPGSILRVEQCTAWRFCSPLSVQRRKIGARFCLTEPCATSFMPPPEALRRQRINLFLPQLSGLKALLSSYIMS